MARRTFKSLAGEIPAAAKPDPYVYASREDYEAGMEAVAKDETLSGSERAEILSGTVEPDETYEEYIARHADE